MSKKTNVCVTCDLWRGDQRWPSEDRFNVIYEVLQRGVCSGPLRTGESMTPLGKCRGWRMWKKLNRPRIDRDDTYTKHFGLEAEQRFKDV